MEIRLGENTFDEINISDCDEFEHCDTHAEVIESMVSQIYSGISMVTGRTLSSSSNLLSVPLLVMSAVNVGIILTFEVFIVCKAVRSTPSRRHLFLSQALLLGLLLGSSLGFASALEPSGAACVVMRLGTGVAYALMYSALLVKQVFLISLNTGVYLPAAYQALLFSFCLLVQIVIGVQWLVLVPLCQYQAHQHIFSLFYIVFLIIFVTCMALKFRNIEENFSESFYISIVMIFTIIIWIFWVISASLVPTCIGLGLVVSCSMTFVVMFLPRDRRLALLGPSDIYLVTQDTLPTRHQDTEYLNQEHLSARTHSYRAHAMCNVARSGYQGYSPCTQHIPAPSQPWSPLIPSYSQFPSLFYPDNLYQYWHHYYPRNTGIGGYSRKKYHSSTRL